LIAITKLNGGMMIINADLIETVEATPDTIISLTTGKKYMVRDTVEEIIAKVIEFRRKLSPVGQEIESYIKKDPEN